MHPYVLIPAWLLGLILLLLGGGWCWHWRKKTDPEERKNWQFGLFLAGAGGILLTGLVTLPPWPTYGLMMMLGCLAVLGFGVRWSTQRGLLSMEHMIEFLLLAGLCGLVGARAVYLVEQWDARFADRAPVLRSPGVLAPLAADDTLLVRTHGTETTTVTFTGAETDTGRVRERIAAQAVGSDLVVEPITTRYRGDEGVVTHERGILLKTKKRGPEATLEILGGSAAPKLGLQNALGTPRGEARPWTLIFDLRKGGLTYFGSVFGVLLFSVVYLRFRGVKPLAMLEMMAPVLPLGLFFGRLGCLARGCCFGREVGEGALFPGVCFPTWSPPWYRFAEERLNTNYDPLLGARGELPPELASRLGPYGDLENVKAAMGPLYEQTPPLHAAQLYEGLTVLLIFALVWIYRDRFSKRVGESFAVLILLQAPVRFAVEHMRRDHDVFFDLGFYPFTESQLVALGMGVFGAVLFGVLRQTGEPIVRGAAAAEAPGAPEATEAPETPEAPEAPEA